MHNAKLALALHFMEEEPQAAARKLELQDADYIAALLEKAPAQVAARVLSAMLPVFAAPVLLALDTEEAARLLKVLNNADIAALLRQLSDKDRHKQLALLPLKKQTACLLLLSYPDYTLGAWTETDLLVLDEQMDVADAMLRLKKRAFSETGDIYVVNDKRQIRGKLSIYALLRAANNQQVHRLMQPVEQSVSGFTELSAALKLDIWQRQDTVAVINQQQELLGIIHHHQLRHALTRSAVSAPLEPLPGDILGAYGASINALLDLIAPPQTGRQEAK